MKSSTLLLEIGTEDLPARFLTPAIIQLRENSESILRENRIQFSNIHTYGTPRRLVLIVEGLPFMQDDRTKEVFGPSKKAAYDNQGKPTKAALGFAHSQGIGVEALILKQKDKGEYVVAVVEKKGLPVKDLLPELCKKIIVSLRFPKSMRWGNSTIRFLRPICWLTALFEKDTIDFEIDGIRSTNFTRGHRFLSPAPFQIEDISGYKKVLANNHVIVDQVERKKIITEQMEKLLEPFNEKAIQDEELLETVTQLVEYPAPVLCSFPIEYLQLPRELLITVMKGHQKYFAVENKDGKLTNHFVVISNTSKENSETVRIGAERVIKARFEDARFYFEEDTKKKLYERIEDLGKVTFQEKLGSLYEKTQRLMSLSGFFTEKLLPAAKDDMIRTAQLAKTDLITGIVREFPELQGTIGKYYALHDGEKTEVAEALEEQYLPAHSGGRLPHSDLGSIISVIDKIDSIVAFFSIGLIPTGSEDPFALRRQALGITAILIKRGYKLTIQELIDEALKKFKDVRNIKETTHHVQQFFENRIETVLSDQRYSHDLVQSIVPLSLHIQLSEIRERLAAIQNFKNSQEYNNFLLAIKRVHNIIPKTAIPELNMVLLIEEPEKILKEKLDSVRSDLQFLLKKKEHADAVKLISSLTDPINIFFDRVLVMDKNEEIKLNRLSLLNEVWKTALTIADFSKLTLTQEQ